MESSAFSWHPGPYTNLNTKLEIMLETHEMKCGSKNLRIGHLPCDTLTVIDPAIVFVSRPCKHSSIEVFRISGLRMRQIRLMVALFHLNL